MKKYLFAATVLVFSSFVVSYAPPVKGAEWATPCAKAGSCGGSRGAGILSNWTVGGYMEGTIRANSHGTRSTYIDGEHIPGNGDVFGGGNGSTNFNLNQLWLSVEREMDASKGFDWGAKFDICFGMDGSSTQKWHDRTLDYDWTTGDYGTGINNLKMMFGYKKLTFEVGLLETPLGWEGPQSWDNFFMSGALVNGVMATTHIGFMATYEMNDRLTVSGGLTNGYDNGENRFDDVGFIGCVDLALTKRLQLTYAVTIDKMNDGVYSGGEFRYGDEYLGNGSGYCHSLDLCWNLTDRFYWMVEWALGNQNFRNGGEHLHLAGYGINNYIVYTLNDRWAFGTRIEWFRDNGISMDPSDYNEISLGLNWTPVKVIKIRPELRYDWVCGEARPFADNTKATQLSGGVSLFCRY